MGGTRVTDAEEIRKAFFDIGAYKATGVDGIPAAFYHHNWDIVHKEVVEMIINIWRNTKNVKLINETMLVLILKVDRPEFLNQLRPIFLCNVIVWNSGSIVHLYYELHIFSQLHCVVEWQRSQSFNPSRGIRQGDLLSPYLFVICMDQLTHLIMEGVDNGSWNPMRAGRNGPQISHLMFADDLILFVEASSE
ncbi:putative mitochondrial protein [Arachis hypogaea]|nr:putative mitochondrial protein [Arachis hypogaea]